jgi:hypothetical protein
MTQSMKGGFLRDDTTGALVVSGGGGGLTQPLALNQPFTITDQSTTPPDHEASIGPRTDPALTFPVPVIKPTKANSVIALDVTPNGTPSNNAGNGIAWIDVCDTDIRTVVGGNVATTRIAAFSDHGEVSTRRFGSATTRPLHIAADYDGVSAPAIKLVPGAPNVLNLGLDGGLTSVGNVSGSSQVPFLVTQNATSAAAGVIRGRTGTTSTNDLFLFQDGTPSTVLSVTYAGQFKFVAANSQTTVGAAGAASAMPTPREYIKCITGNGAGVIPVCNP